jgi:hypothetical protein
VQLIAWGSFSKITEVVTTFLAVKFVFDSNGLGYILGDVFTNSSGIKTKVH